MITLGTLRDFLLGRAAAIRLVATHRCSLRFGLLFVLAAGFAREYDGEDLLHAPWHLALPLVASLLTSLVLYVILRVLSLSFGRRGVPRLEGPFFAGYPALLRLYWWTAPLALVYALPVEHWMSPGRATATNFALLGIVSLWRVVLITRAVSVAWRTPAWAVIFPVMLFADGVALLLTTLLPVPVFSMMGGVRLTESEQVIQDVTCGLQIFGLMALPLWVLGAVLTWRARLRGDLPEGAPTLVGEADGRASRPLSAFAGLLLAVWLPILPATQPAQQRRRQVEQHLRAGRLEAAVASARAHPRDAFPPHWAPPPRPGYGERAPEPMAVLETALAHEAPVWFVVRYLEKMRAIHTTPTEREPVRAALSRYAHLARLEREHPSLVAWLREPAPPSGPPRPG